MSYNYVMFNLYYSTNLQNKLSHRINLNLITFSLSLVGETIKSSNRVQLSPMSIQTRSGPNRLLYCPMW
uniref:Uncharacterized protein n=1 Tax=Pararge aegeria TaxID=116150 RepID=S4P2R8_9NEOP